MANDWRARVWQGEIIVAAVSALDKVAAMKEISHYARQYEQDGPIRIEILAPRRSKPRKGRMPDC
jgi:hypothetical protein